MDLGTKVKRRCKGTTNPLLAILDISLMQLTLYIWYIQYVHTNVDAVRIIDDSIYVHIVSYPDPPSTLQEEIAFLNNLLQIISPSLLRPWK